MKRLRCNNVTSVAFIGILFCSGVVEVMGHTIMSTLDASAIEPHNKFIIQVYNSGCECIKYDCGCCQRLNWGLVSLNGTLCINTTYLDNDYGISLTLTFNNLIIFNETITARNPPPFCFGDDIYELFDAEICLRIYDIELKKDKFHACFEVSGKIMKFTIAKIHLGCLHFKSSSDIKYINEIIENVQEKKKIIQKKIEDNWSLFFRKKIQKDTLPNVIMV
ncbi:hypothetical protein PUN28_014839 [Cardiocondyla obscurior]|uniref:DUF4773 domain-containing protein n=1 Tax=Cardiocondyla obscurior TaxID=286306 RepID=A0AAW2EZJ6_9HYME